MSIYLYGSLLIYFVLLSSGARLSLRSCCNIISSYKFVPSFLPLIRLALIISGDIETNPGPENLCDQNLSLCHWNLNGTRMTPVMNFCGFHGRVNSRKKQNYNRVQKYLEELKFITKIDTTRKVLSFTLSFQTV